MTDEKVTYLVQYEYIDEPGSFWPARAFLCRRKADSYAFQMTLQAEATKRLYTVVPLILDQTREKTRRRSPGYTNPTLF